MAITKLFLVIQCSFAIVNAKIACLDAEGNSVNHWAIFKFPTGTDYAYWDSNIANIAIQSDSLNSTTEGALALTMGQLWADKSVGYAFYNDEIPNSSVAYNFSVGHSKGVWMWDEELTAAVFIQHSVPKFPTSGPESVASDDNIGIGYQGLPPNAWDYGQHLACFSLNFSDLEIIAQNFQHVVPQIYENRGTFDTLTALLEGAYNSNPVCSVFTLTSSNKEIIGFAKTAAWDSDLYEACISAHLDKGFAVESWLHGNSPLGSTCMPYEVTDIMTLSFGVSDTLADGTGEDGVSFANYEDHSKWAVSNSGQIVCFADINRMESQFARNGAGLCFQDSGLWQAMRAIVNSTDSECL